MTDWITGLVLDLGYAGLALLMLIENVFPPIPSEIIMPLGGFLVSQGELALTGVILAGSLGSVTGSLLLFILGRQFRRRRLEQWAERHGQWLLITAGDVQQAFAWFERHGHKAVFLARLVPGVRSLISLPAGSSAMHPLPFLLYTGLGTVMWCSALAWGGMALGAQYERLSRLVQQAGTTVVLLLLLAAAAWILKRLWKRRRGP